MTQYTEPRPGWGSRFYRFLQRPIVFVPLIWIGVLISAFANYRVQDIANFVIQLIQHR